MSEKLQQAITSIKTGNKQLGQQLLAQVLQGEPNNELAWLWMSAVVSADKRRYCIEQVLKINPNNQQAGQALEKLRQLETKPPAIPSAIPHLPKPGPAVAPFPQSNPAALQENTTGNSSSPAPLPAASPQQSITPEFWINPTRKTIHFFVLLEDKLMTAKIEPHLANQFRNKMLQGSLPTDLMTEKISATYRKIIRAKEIARSLKIYFNDENNREQSMEMECKDNEMLLAIFDAMQRRLGPDFERASAPMSKGAVITGNGILMAIVFAVSAFLYYGLLDFESSGASPTGSARTRGIIVLLSWIGPNGIVCIGGGLLLLVLISMISSLATPPIITSLTRKDSRETVKSKKADFQFPKPEPAPVQNTNIPAPVQTEEKSPSLIGAALSDGLMAGLIGGLIGIPLPILNLLTGESVYFVFGFLVAITVMLFTGIAVGFLFYRRKLRRGSVAVGIGGGFGGAIAGAICGLILGFSSVNNLADAGMDMSNVDNLTSFPIMFCILLAFVSSLVGALTAWIPGLFIKPDPNLKPVDWRENRSEIEVARIEALQSHSKRRMKNRLIIAGVLAAIFFIVFLCQALAR